MRSLLGRAVEVLIEEEETGYSREYVRVRVPGAKAGEIVAPRPVEGRAGTDRRRPAPCLRKINREEEKHGLPVLQDHRGGDSLDHRL